MGLGVALSPVVEGKQAWGGGGHKLGEDWAGWRGGGRTAGDQESCSALCPWSLL